jgi:hypothetical protein
VRKGDGGSRLDSPATVGAKDRVNLFARKAYGRSLCLSQSHFIELTIIPPMPNVVKVTRGLTVADKDQSHWLSPLSSILRPQTDGIPKPIASVHVTGAFLQKKVC